MVYQDSTYHSPRRSGCGTLLISALVLVAVVAGLGVWANATDRWPFNLASGSYRDLSATGVAVGDNAPQDIKAVTDPRVKPQLPQLIQPLGGVTHITPDGKLSGEVTLRFKLSRPATDPADVLITYSTTGKPHSWQVMAPSEVSSDGQYAYVKTTHLSWWQPITRSLNDLANAAVEEVKSAFNSLTADSFVEAEKPKCQNEKEARNKGYFINWKGTDVLYWCLGLEGGKPVAHIVNRRRYPVYVNHAGISVVRPKSKYGVEQLARTAFRKDRTVLLPFEQMQLNVQLNKGEAVGVTTEFGGFAEAIYALQVGATTAANILTRFGVGTVSKGANGFDGTAELMSTLLDVQECGNVFRDDNASPIDVVSNCFSAATLTEAFGWKGALLGNVIVVGPVFNMFRSSFNGLGDQFNGRSNQTLIIGYTPPAAPKALFVGTWGLRKAEMIIKSNGTGTYFWGVGPCAGDSQGVVLCNGHANLTFKVQGDHMVGTYTRVWYTTSDDRPVPDGFDGADSSRTAGLTFTLRRNSAHTLISEDGTGSKPGGPYLCDSSASPDERALCGG